MVKPQFELVQPHYRISSKKGFGGDSVERGLWKKLKKNFPNYEYFRSQLIIPITDAPSVPKLRSDIYGEWIIFAERHWSILVHLGAAQQRARTYGKHWIAFGDVYSHLGTVIDLTKSLLWTIQFFIEIKDKPAGQKITKFPEFEDREAFDKIMNHWWEKGRKRYRTILYNSNHYTAFNPFINRESKVLVEPLKKRLANESKRISQVRNRAVHDRIRPSISAGNEESWEIKTDLDVLDELDTMSWPEVWALIDTEKKRMKYFAPADQTMANDILSVCTLLNDIWGYILATHLKDLSKVQKREVERANLARESEMKKSDKPWEFPNYGVISTASSASISLTPPDESEIT